MKLTCKVSDYEDDDVIKHKRDNAAILYLLGHDNTENWPENDIEMPNMMMWQTNITDKIGPELGDKWKQYEDQAAAHYGNAGGLKKNPLAISRALENAWNNELKSQALQSLINRILPT